MSTIPRKIKDGMSIEEILTVMAEDSPGARLILKKVYERDIFDVMRLDKLQIRGEKICILYEECCQKRDDKFYLTLVLMKNNMFSQEQIHKNLESKTPISFIDDNIKVEGISSYDELSSVNKKWTPWCEEQKESFERRLALI